MVFHLIFEDEVGARHAPLNTWVNYAVGSCPTGSITKPFMK